LNILKAELKANHRVRERLFLLQYLPATLATPEPIKDWSLTTLKDKLIKIGAKVVSHGRYVVFQMAEVAIARQMFQEILRLIAELRPQPPPALHEMFDVMHSRATDRRSASKCQGNGQIRPSTKRSGYSRCW
jgi:Transposase DDE domain group 1